MGAAARLAGPAEIRAFRDDGAAVVRGVVDAGWLGPLADAIDEAVGSPGPLAKDYAPEGAPRYFTDHRLFSRFEGFRRFLFEGPLPQLAAELLGASRVDLYDEHLLVKEAGSPAPTHWHHDMPYFSVDGDDLVSVWLSPDPVTAETGALRFARGSHRWGRLYRPVKIGVGEPVAGFDRDELADAVPDIDGDPERYPTVTLETEPGDVVVFHGLALHSSGPNTRADVARRAVSYRFAGDDIRWRNRSESPLIFDRALDDGDPLSLIADQCPRVWPRA